MITILYNPLSRNGSNGKIIKRVKNIINKKFKEPTELVNFFEVNMEEFVGKLKENDKVVLVGGDGTLNYAANYLVGKELNNEFYLYKAGTGNDFGRSFKEKLILLNNHITNLPKTKFNGKEYVFINGCGIGVDGETCYLVDNSGRKKNKLNFFKCACKSFFNFKKMDIEMTIDGKTMTFDKVWFVTVMNGKYFGGGMKLAPDAIREDDILEIVLVRKLKLLFLLGLFPSIYLGIHYALKGYVKHFKGQDIKIKVLNGKYTEQHDGETNQYVEYLEIRR